MNLPHPTRRQFLRLGARLATAATVGASFSGCQIFQTANSRRIPDFNVLDFGAVGDGVRVDTRAIQHAIDAASVDEAPARVVVPGGRRYLTGGLKLHDRIEFHLADDAELLANPDLADYSSALSVLSATDATGVRISGTGSINGQWKKFTTNYDATNEWWRLAMRRPRLCLFTSCEGLEVSGVTLFDSSNWTLHLLGCDNALVEKVTIRNPLDVPNCDGIDLDHCRDVEVRRCDIICGDDAIVVKTSRQTSNYGPCANIHVHDCAMTTQDSGLKIGTETTQDIHDIIFEDCDIRSSCRGLCIQLRDTGNVSKVRFGDINFLSRYHSDPWWGRGEAISFTALPRNPQTTCGTISDIRVENVMGRAENSIRLQGTPGNPIRNVTFANVDVTLDRWTKYPGGIFDNRPTTALTTLENHTTPGINLRYADAIALDHCRIAWGKNIPDYFTNAIEAENTTNLSLNQFSGEAAHPGRNAARKIIAPTNPNGIASLSPGLRGTSYPGLATK